jgi:uncharacterized RDD family membrane protein YckC
MDLVCPSCSQLLQFAGRRPTFCGYCGKTLPAPEEAPTVPPDTAVAAPGGAGDEDPAEIGGYRLLNRLGEGGMGRVYEAEEIGTGRRVALKLIAPRYVESPEAVERFRREGRLASMVTHPRCVFILAADETGGRPYIVMELMPGKTLQDLVNKDGPLPVEQALARILEIIDGLRELHRLGIVHRDVKPSNCLLDAEGRAKLGDFGLSRSLVRADALTRTGSFVGTPLFASPEQIKGESVGPASDVYSVAATLYYLLVGKAPFQGGDHAATLARIASDPAPPMRLARADLPVALDRVVLRGLERDPDKRWRSLDDFESALAPFLPGRLSIGGLGIRCGAYFIDYAILFILGLPLMLKVMAEAFHASPQRYLTLEHQWPALVMGISSWLLYFGGCDALWGCTLGKFLLGLRVATPRAGERPRLLAVASRTVQFCVLLNLGTTCLWLLLLAYALDPDPEHPAHQMFWGLLVNAVFYPAEVIGVLLMCCTMRARNGYRGLHEWGSGTCVVQLPERAWRPPTRPEQEWTLSWPEGLPAQVGPFKVEGLFSAHGPVQVLVAHDATLDRLVWIWRRPANAEPLAAARIGLNRATRLRWLGGGVDAEHRWDAFLAPMGRALAVDAKSLVCTWRDVRQMLGDLADELIAAKADGTRPSDQSIGHVWVRSDGRITLLDTAVGPAEARSDSSPLELLADTAILALAARPRRAHGERIAVGVPLPCYARTLVGRLIGIGEPFKNVKQFREALAAVADRPPETTRMRRLAHLAVQAAFYSLTWCFGVGLAGALPAFFAVSGWGRIEYLEQLGPVLAEVERQDAEAREDPDPARRNRAVVLAAALDYALREARSQRQARLESLGWFNRNYLDMMERQLADFEAKHGQPTLSVPPASQPNSVRNAAESAIAEKHDMVAEAVGVGVAQTVLVIFWPALWILWACITRGGLSLLIAGLALVGPDGRPALRAQAGARALVVWLPVTGLAVAAIWLHVAYWAAGAGDANRWMIIGSEIIWWAAMALLPVYVFLALLRPSRSLHDYLAATCVVPR